MIWNNLEKLNSYGETCNDWAIPCDYTLGLMCSSGSGTDCKCPNTYSGGYCDCPTTKYWNGTKCCNLTLFIYIYMNFNKFWLIKVPRYGLNQGSCSSDYMCTYNTGLVCHGVLKTCQCPTYYNQ